VFAGKVRFAKSAPTRDLRPHLTGTCDMASNGVYLVPEPGVGVVQSDSAVGGGSAAESVVPGASTLARVLGRRSSGPKPAVVPEAATGNDAVTPEDLARLEEVRDA